MNVPTGIVNDARALTRAAAEGTNESLRTVLFYTKGQSLGGASGDDAKILTALREAGLDARMVDLSDVQQAANGSLLLRDPASGVLAPWRDPHSALMYHGAIAPPRSMELLRAMEARGTVVVNGPDAWPIFTDKALFADYMGTRGVRVIPTTEVTSREAMHAALDANGGEAILKKPVSTEGDDIFVVRSHADVDEVADQLDELGGRLIAQPLVDSRIDASLEPGIAARVHPEELGRRHEFRINSALMPSGAVQFDAAYMRIAPDAEQVVNNVAQGARAIGIDFADLHPADQQTMLHAVRSAPPGGRLLGWDLIGRPGHRMVIEANSGSGLPNGSEGIDPRQVVKAYGTIMRDAAARSPLARTAP
ncbi:MAG: N5-carboxyaminoimidazole ribonucleotide synthase [Thermoleophilia bacterium]|nr:N5-carboxyaminoimidazole ribonucleotide synthase [Thermoleophilia bacterium]